MKKVIGIDAGGTKTEALVLDHLKNVLFETKAGHGNPAVSYEETLKNISICMKNCFQYTGSNQISNIVIGMAGAGAGDTSKRLVKDLKKLTSVPILVISDAQLAFYSLIGNQNGILTIAGTGSISYGRNDNHEKITGGWGHLLGDPGSAYSIAVEACKTIFLEEETSKPFSPLSRALLQEIQADNSRGLKGFIYSSTKGAIAQLAIIVHKEAIAGNEQAVMFLSNAGHQLAGQAIRLIDQLMITDDFLVAMKGSVLEKSQFVQSAFKQAVMVHSPRVKFLTQELSPAIGAMEVLKNLEKGMIHRD
ncbi:N-acetylglucosamine kinase-like BadF-type ATPase [Bacillus pakistanensis]|uniref:N-acetylglucosamine kinase-like BadF-type ATPase n=1 Tax=Rossellomorea pakistanensis TaxID=992288 RepID=A0ABS2NCM7_9BACI|nr:BadF/BadG/BcrA/BcrD ATPase family protein [Bacillus pakistanensis]MBM7585616.1 N-acetylglucosamine kinase-like BadF-type ATPase [Bacillus pakistanensis]